MKKTIRQRIARAIDDQHGLRLSPYDVVDLDRLLPPLPKIYHTVSQDPFMTPYGKGLLFQAQEAQNAYNKVLHGDLANNVGYVPHGLENEVKYNWLESKQEKEYPGFRISISKVEKKTVLQSFKEKAWKYQNMMDTFLRNYFHRGSN